MPSHCKSLARYAVAACLLLTAARHAPNYTHKPGTLGAGVAAVSLAGPCVAYGYRSTPDSPGAILALDGDGLLPGRSAYKQLRETAIYDCAPARFNLFAGELFNQHLDQASADPFIAVTYTVVQGPWRISLGGGFLYSRAKRSPVRWNIGPVIPYFSVQGTVRW